MTAKGFEAIIELPEGCTVEIANGMISVKGSKGEVKKNLFNPIVSIKSENNTIKISTKTQGKKNKKIVNTYKAHIKNMFKGSNEGHTYKLRICSGHFPMSVEVKGNEFMIKNFIGEKVPRTLAIREGTEVKIDGTEITVESLDKEKAGQMAASIEQLTRRSGFDKRIFQDGIYITEKDGKAM